MTGLSVAGAIGSALIDNRFSREAESQADAFAAATGKRLRDLPMTPARVKAVLEG